MIRRFLAVVALFIAPFIASAQGDWDLFDKATFKDEYIEEYFSYATLLDYDDYAKSLDGKNIELKGYFIPVMDESKIILSKYPYANCFFCGGAGLESVVEIRLTKPTSRKFELDERLTFKGKLKLNHTDWQFVAFILEDASIVE